jgi:hypothetical protein
LTPKVRVSLRLTLRVPVYKGSFWSLPTGINRGLEWTVFSVGALV